MKVYLPFGRAGSKAIINGKPVVPGSSTAFGTVIEVREARDPKLLIVGIHTSLEHLSTLNHASDEVSQNKKGKQNARRNQQHYAR